jgi:hypothetical protein
MEVSFVGVVCNGKLAGSYVGILGVDCMVV